MIFLVYNPLFYLKILVKTVIDKHITENYNYYLAYCNRLYKGRYLKKDLINEFYIVLSNIEDEIIIRYNDKNNLKVLCIYIIRDLFRNRNCIKKNKNGKTSNLNEINDFFSYEMLENRVEEVNGIEDTTIYKTIEDGCFIKEFKDKTENENKINHLFDCEEEILCIIKDEIFSSMDRFYSAKDPNNIKNNDFDMAVFVCSQNESINSISKRTKINRVSLTASKNRAELKLKRLILK